MFNKKNELDKERDLSISENTDEEDCNTKQEKTLKLCDTKMVI